MNVSLTAWHDSSTCTWCEKEKECVTANFGDGFIRESDLCWTCLKKAMKVRARQAQQPRKGPTE